MIVSTPGFFLRRYLARWFFELSNATQKFKRERPGAELSYALRRGYFKKQRNDHMRCGNNTKAMWSIIFDLVLFVYHVACEYH